LKSRRAVVVDVSHQGRLARSSDHTLNRWSSEVTFEQASTTSQTTSTSEDEVTDITTRMANPTADWEKVGDKFYRKIQLYTAVFDQDLELENYIVTGCSYGGAIGMPLLSTVGFLHESFTVRETVRFRYAQWKGTELLNLTMT
jgi:hypothetical protein